MILEAVAILAALIALALLVTRQGMVRGTTLVASWWWLSASIAFLLATEILIASAAVHQPAATAWRFLFAVSSVCPGIALLGAKRPQYAGWQWIVASLWLVLALPALQQLVMHPDTRVQIHSARVVFMVAIVLFCMGNSMFSRHAISVVLATVGQISLLMPFLFDGTISQEITQPAGILFISMAICVTRFRPQSRADLDRFDQLWLEFRDMFGLVWSLRFMERFNATAGANSWDVILSWSGFRSGSGQSPMAITPQESRVFRQTLTNLLRRFVSAEWISTRLGNDES